MKFNINKAYSALNADKVKIGCKGYFANNVAELKSAAEKNIKNYLSKMDRVLGEGFMCRFMAENGICYPFFYPFEETKELWTCPYNNLTEMINDYTERFIRPEDRSKNSLPFIFIKSKQDDGLYLITAFLPSHILLNTADSTGNVSVRKVSFEKLFSSYTYLDGSACGTYNVTEEE